MTLNIHGILGKAIRRHRKAAHITQKQLAASIGKSTSFVGHVERGTRKMSMETMLDIIIALRIEPNEMFMDIVPTNQSDGWEKSKLERLAAVLSGGDGEHRIIDRTMEAMQKTLTWLSLLAEMEKLIEQSDHTQ